MPGAPIVWDDICSPAYRLSTKNAASSSHRNVYLELIEKGPRAGKFRLRSIPGMKLFATLPGSPMRALMDADSGNALYGICEDKVYQINSDGTSAALTGSVGLNNHPAIMRTNGFQVAIASAGRLYIAQGSPAPGRIDPANFTDGTPVLAATVDFLDQYFIVNPPSSKQVYLSNLAPDGQIFDPGNSAFKEGYPDNISRVFANNEILWLMGFDTTEPWSNSGALFPFDRVNDIVLNIGCSAPYSVAKAAGWQFWLWRGAVYAAKGLDPQPISDIAVEEAIATYGDVSNAEGWCYQVGQRIFYAINFPSVGKTWFFDLSTKAWHERGLWDGVNYGIYRGRVYARAFGKDLVGCPYTGNIYELNEDYHFDAEGKILRCEITSPYFTDNMQVIRYNQLTVDANSGVGLDVPEGQPGFDPTLIMRYSDTRGKLWSNEREASLGRIGQDNIRVIYNQLGAGRIGRVVQLILTDPVPLSINTAYWDLGPRVKGR